MPKQPQIDLLEPEKIWHASLLAKVEGLIDGGQFSRLESCGKMEVYRTCEGCGAFETFWSHCNMKFCPMCNWRIARRRAELLRAWTLHVTQPKHVVLTMKNQPVLTKRTIRVFQKAFSRLRRAKLFADVTGGCLSMEITNEGTGWHVHGHVLCNVRFIDVKQLAKKWGRLVNQDFGVVYVKDCRGSQYLQEVTKYCVKPAQMVAWAPEEIAQFIGTVSKCRLFATFGELFNLRKQLKREMAAAKPAAQPCKCGSCDFTWSSEESEVLAEIRKAARR